MLPPDLAADVMALHPQRKRRVCTICMLAEYCDHTHVAFDVNSSRLQGRPVLVEEGEGDISSVSDDR